MSTRPSELGGKGGTYLYLYLTLTQPTFQVLTGFLSDLEKEVFILSQFWRREV